MNELRFEAVGTPAPMGSSFTRTLPDGRHFTVRSGDNAIRKFQRVVKNAALEARTGLPLPTSDPVRVDLVFWFKRPKKHYRTGRFSDQLRDDAPRQHVDVPDLDKLARTTLDAMSGVIYVDDAQVDRLVLSKKWADHEFEGVAITVRFG